MIQSSYSSHHTTCSLLCLFSLSLLCFIPLFPSSSVARVSAVSFQSFEERVKNGLTDWLIHEDVSQNIAKQCHVVGSELVEIVRRKLALFTDLLLMDEEDDTSDTQSQHGNNESKTSSENIGLSGAHPSEIDKLLNDKLTGDKVVTTKQRHAPSHSDSESKFEAKTSSVQLDSIQSDSQAETDDAQKKHQSATQRNASLQHSKQHFDPIHQQHSAAQSQNNSKNANNDDDSVAKAFISIAEKSKEEERLLNHMKKELIKLETCRIVGIALNQFHQQQLQNKKSQAQITQQDFINQLFQHLHSHKNEHEEKQDLIQLMTQWLEDIEHKEAKKFESDLKDDIKGMIASPNANDREKKPKSESETDSVSKPVSPRMAIFLRLCHRMMLDYIQDHLQTAAAMDGLNAQLAQAWQHPFNEHSKSITINMWRRRYYYGAAVMALTQSWSLALQQAAKAVSVRQFLLAIEKHVLQGEFGMSKWERVLLQQYHIRYQQRLSLRYSHTIDVLIRTQAEFCRQTYPRKYTRNKVINLFRAVENTILMGVCNAKFQVFGR